MAVKDGDVWFSCIGDGLKFKVGLLMGNDNESWFHDGEWGIQLALVRIDDGQ